MMKNNKLTLLIYSGSGVTKVYDYAQIDACACEVCQYNPFVSTSTFAPEITTQIPSMGNQAP